VIVFEDVTKEYKLDEGTIITPVSHVNLKINQGELIIIVGRSGTGKTTLLNLAAGLVKPTGGRVTVDNKNLAAMNDLQISSLRSQNMGFMFQFPSLLPSLTVRENVSLPSIFIKNGHTDVNQLTETLISTLGLTAKLDVYPKQLSAGEQKRVVIARSLINNPRLVLADEPTSDLDNRTEAEVMSILRDINAKGTTFLIVTHSLELIEFASRAFEMEKGAIKQIK
jgi:putative ABC transport system ATP-binding protein